MSFLPYMYLLYCQNISRYSDVFIGMGVVEIIEGETTLTLSWAKATIVDMRVHYCAGAGDRHL